MTTPLPHIAGMASYALADLSLPDGIVPVVMSQNESLRAPSPHVIESVRHAAAATELYPDPDWTKLRHALSRHHDVSADQILCGAGSLDLIGALARVYAGPERAVLAPAHAYPFFATASRMANARFDVARETQETVSTDAILQAVRPDTGLVFLANPGNPTGTRISAKALSQLRDSLREDILLVIDEAYGEFADHLDAYCYPLVNAGNCVVLRTFSKAYGLAGFRVGWGLFPAVIAAQMRKVMNPNNLSTLSQVAAVAALEDAAYMVQTCALTTDLRQDAHQRLSAIGYNLRPSFTNFLLIPFETAQTAQRAERLLRQEGILLRRQAAAGLPHMLRMTIGPKPALDRAMACLENFATGELS